MSNLYTRGVINIPNVTGNIVITATATPGVVDSIAAAYTQSGTVYDIDSLDSLKDDLVVTATYEGGASSTVSNYTLIGTLAEGTSTIAVSYGGKTATFGVVVTAAIPSGYTKHDYIYNNTINVSQIIDTGLSANYNIERYDHEITFLFKTTPSVGYASHPMYGVRQTSGSDPASRGLWEQTVATHPLACNYNGIDTGFIMPMINGTKYTSVTSNKQWIVNGEVLQSNMDSGSYTPPDETATIRIFGNYTASLDQLGYMRGTMYLYGFSIYDTTENRYIAKMIPCTNSQNVAGLYDIIRRIFYTATRPDFLTAGDD